MDIAIEKGSAFDRIEVLRADGSRAAVRFPKKGPFPHDAVHWVAETVFGLDRGFWGIVAGGLDPEQVGKLAKTHGHASAARPAEPDLQIVQLIQSERLVECLEAELWSAPADLGTFVAVFDAACRESRVPPLAIEPASLERARSTLDRLRQKWAALAIGESLSLLWES